jgi:Ca-activated chloride channel family protein
MQQLADASGGRLFPAKSIRDLAPVYAQVAEELRSVYSIGYYPQNQKFDGKYRRIEVRVKRPGLTLRTRPGYYAW